MMTAGEYAKYTLDNLCRATLANAFNISSKIDVQGCYTFKDFATGLKDYAILRLQQTNSDLYYDIITTINKHIKLYDSSISCNKRLLIDDLIIDLWTLINEDK